MRWGAIILAVGGVALACSANDDQDTRAASQQADGGGGVSGAGASPSAGAGAASGARTGSGGTVPAAPPDARTNAAGGDSNTHDGSGGDGKAPDASSGEDASVGSGGRDASSGEDASVGSGGRDAGEAPPDAATASGGLASVLCGKQNLTLFDPPAQNWHPTRDMCGTSADCPAGYACVGTVCAETACTPGATGCSPAGVVTCAADGLSFGSVVPCPARTTCVARPGGAECVPWCCDAGGGTCWGKYSFQCFDGLSSPMTSMCSGPQPLPPVGECQDGIRNGVETDIDCGGDQCPNCPRGGACLVDSDCFEACIAGQCTLESLSDGVNNGRETDVDCGGGPWLGCPVGLRCRTARDCTQPSLCAEGFCRAASSCSNGIFDGLETNTDCGGPCPPCSDHQYCKVDADCQSRHCAADGPYFARPSQTEYFMNTCHTPCPSSGACAWTCPGYVFLMLLDTPCCRADDLCGCGSSPNGVFTPGSCTD